MKKLLPIAFFLSMAISINAQNTGIQFAHTTWEQTLKEARKQDKIIFIDAYTTWCGPCKWMTANVFPQEEVGHFYNQHFINLKLDMEKGEGVQFAKTYEVKAYPTLLYINGKGELVHKSLGSRAPQDFIELGETAIDPERQIGTLIRRYEAGDREPEFLKKYALAAKECRTGQVEAIVKEYLKTQKKWLTTENADFILEVASPNPGSELYLFIKETRQDLYKVTEENKVDEFLKTGIYNRFRITRNPSTEQIIEAYKEIFPGEKGDQFAAEFELSQLMMSRKPEDQQRFLKQAVNFLEKYPLDDWSVLNSIAWRFYELTDDAELLRTAKEWARQSIQQNSNYYNNDTMAAICFKLKEKDEALKHAAAAIKLAKEAGADYGETQRLLEKIEALD